MKAHLEVQMFSFPRVDLRWAARLGQSAEIGRLSLGQSAVVSRPFRLSAVLFAIGVLRGAPGPGVAIQRGPKNRVVLPSPASCNVFAWTKARPVLARFGICRSPKLQRRPDRHGGGDQNRPGERRKGNYDEERPATFCGGRRRWHFFPPT